MPPAPADLDDDFDRDDTPEPEAGPRPRHTPVDVLSLPVLPGAEGATQADYDRPTRWEHCIAPEGPNAARPCPWLSCREHALHVLSGDHPVQRAIVHAERLVRFAGLAPGSEPPADTPAGVASAEAERLTLQWLGEVPYSCTLDGAEDGATLAGIGDTIGVSRERVRQIETLGLIACAGKAPGIRAAKIAPTKGGDALRTRSMHPDADKPRETVNLDAPAPRYDPDAVRPIPPLRERMEAREGVLAALADTRIATAEPATLPVSKARTQARFAAEGRALDGPAPAHLAHLPHPTAITAPGGSAWCPTIRAEVTGRLCVLRHRARNTDLARADDNPARFTYRECAECPWAAKMDAAFGPEANRAATEAADPLPGSGDTWTVRVERGRPGAGGFRLPVYDQPPGRGRSRGLGARTPGKARDAERLGPITAPPVTPVATTRRLPRQPDAPDCVVQGCPNTARKATRPDPPTEGMCAVHTVNTQGMVNAYRDRALPGAAVRHYLVTRGTLHGSTAWCREVGILPGPAPRTARAAPALPALYDATGRPLGADAPTPDLAFLAALRGPVEPAGAAPAPPATPLDTDPVTPKDNPTMPATLPTDTASDLSAPLQCTARGCTATEYVAARGKAWGGLCHHHGKKARDMAHTYRIDPGPVVQFVRNHGTTDGVTAYLRTAGIIPPAERITAAAPPKRRARSVASAPVDASPAPATPAPVTVTHAPGGAPPVEAVVTPAGFVSGEVGPVRYTLTVAVDPEALRLLSLGQRMGYTRAVAMLEGLSALAALPTGTVTPADLAAPASPPDSPHRHGPAG